jgi:hypothetical protein
MGETYGVDGEDCSHVMEKYFIRRQNAGRFDAIQDFHIAIIEENCTVEWPMLEVGRNKY